MTLSVSLEEERHLLGKQHRAGDIAVKAFFVCFFFLNIPGLLILFFLNCGSFLRRYFKGHIALVILQLAELPVGMSFYCSSPAAK